MYGLTGSEANSIMPGKRMLSSMTPVIIEKNGKLFLAAGSPGGSTIPTSVLQVIINVIDFGMDIRQAVEAGRFHHQWLPDYISYERNSLDSSTVLTLRSMGYDLKQRSKIGMVNAIVILPDGRLSGSGDNRGDNSVCGY
jgi:gamma-glutamyltranspeptidase/glutathione hydrolase